MPELLSPSGKGTLFHQISDMSKVTQPVPASLNSESCWESTVFRGAPQAAQALPSPPLCSLLSSLAGFTEEAQLVLSQGEWGPSVAALVQGGSCRGHQTEEEGWRTGCRPYPDDSCHHGGSPPPVLPTSRRGVSASPSPLLSRSGDSGSRPRCPARCPVRLLGLL